MIVGIFPTFLLTPFWPGSNVWLSRGNFSHTIKERNTLQTHANLETVFRKTFVIRP